MCGNPQHFGSHGRVLAVDLGQGTHEVMRVEEKVYRQFLGGYGLGAYLMWCHYPPDEDPLAPGACFALCAGLLVGTKTPFAARTQLVGRSPLTGTWADSNSGGSVAAQLRAAGFDALLVRGRAERPTVLVVRDDDVQLEDAGELWGLQIPETFDELRGRFGGRHEVGVSAIGPAGERGSLIAAVMNDRYHACGRQGFGALYGSKNLKAIVVSGSGAVPVAQPAELAAVGRRISAEYRRSLGWWMRLVVWLSRPRRRLGWLYRLMARRGIKIGAPTAAMRQLWAERGTTAAVSMSIENGGAPVKNWRGVGARDFPLHEKGMKLDGRELDRFVTKKLGCGDCPLPCKGIVAVKSRGLKDVRRPDYETICGFGAALLNDDLEIVVACHDACNRYGIDAISTASVLGWVAEAVERGLISEEELDGIPLRWGAGEAALALTTKIGERQGCGAWLSDGVARAAAHVGRGTEAFAVHVAGQEPAYHDPRFTSLMGVAYVADPTPGRHTAGSASWNEAYAAAFPLPGAVPAAEQRISWKQQQGKGVVQAHFSNAFQVLNGLGLCLFTMLIGPLPWTELVNAATGWDVDDAELLRCGERIQNLRAAFNRRLGITPQDFAIHPRLAGEGDGALDAGPLRGIAAPLEALRAEYFAAMAWDQRSGALSRARAEELDIADLLEGYTAE